MAASSSTKGRGRRADDPKAEGLETAELGDVLADLNDERARWELWRGHPTGRGRGRWLQNGQGALTYEWIFENYGGGPYCVHGKVAGSGKKPTWLEFALEGPPIDKQHPNATLESGGEDPRLEMLRELKDELEQLRLEGQLGKLRAEITAMRSGEGGSGKSETTALLEKVFANVATKVLEPPDAAALLNSTFGLMDKLESRRGRSEGGDTLAGVLRDVAPEVVGLFRDFLNTRTGTPGAPARLPLTAGSRAEVLEPLESIVMKLLAHANRKHLPAAELAEDAEVLLTEEELALIQAASLEQLTTILSAASDTNPSLRDPRVADYVRVFLEELKKVAAENDAGAAPSSSAPAA